LIAVEAEADEGADFRNRHGCYLFSFYRYYYLNFEMNPAKLIFCLILVIVSIGCVPQKPFLDRYETETQFISTIGNQSAHTLRGFALDKTSNIYVSGTTFGSVDVCGNKYSGGHAGLLVKIRPDLECAWSSFFEARKDRGTCILREAFLDTDDRVLVPGICHGELHIDGDKKFDAIGKFQSFVVKMDTSGKVIWLERYFVDQDFTISNLIKTGKDRYTGIGVKDETITVLFEMDAQGKLLRSAEFADPEKIYNNILLQRGKKLFMSSIGVHFVSIRELDADWAVDWELVQDTKCSLMAIKAHIGVDIRNGLWISVPFNTETTDFVFGRDTLKGTGLLDSYLTQYRGRQQQYSAHIKGEGDQIVTGFFDGDQQELSFALSHGEEFEIAGHTYTGSAGISLIEFNAENPDTLVYSTFPIENKERDRVTNTGVYFRREKGRHAYLGGCVIKGETQTTNPTMTVGDDLLVIERPVFSSFIVKGTKKESLR